MSEKLQEICERWAEMPHMGVGVNFEINRDFLYDIESKEVIATMQRELDRDRSCALSQAKSDIDCLLAELSKVSDQAGKGAGGVSRVYGDIQAREVVWYRQYGKHPMWRIRRDGSEREYVIGDHDWNRNHPDKFEQVEHLMPRGEPREEKR